MAAGESRKRLDALLMQQGAVTETQVAEALMRQRAHGGRFGSHLLYFRYVTEHQLVTALATQMGCEGVILSEASIPDEVIASVPEKTAMARRVVPFEHVEASRLLKVACEDPGDSTLLQELSFVAKGLKIQLFVAPELVITATLERYYQHRGEGLGDYLQLALPDVAGDSKTDRESTTDSEFQGQKPGVVLVTQEVYAAPLLQSLLEREEHRVFVVSDFEAALNTIRQERIQSVLIHRAVTGDHEAFVNRVRRLAPGAMLRFYDAPSALLLQEQQADDVGYLGVKGLELFTSLLATQGANPSGRMGRYTETLCQKLGLSIRDRLVCTHAAYLHDLARLQFATDAKVDRRQLVALSRRLLASVSYPQPVLDILDAMYSDPPQATDSLSLAELGGRILTLVELFCQNVDGEERLSRDRFNTVKKKLRDLSGKLIPPEIVEAFIELLQEEILNLQVTRKQGQIMLFVTDAELRNTLELRLKNEGFRTVSESQESALIDLHRRSVPDILLVVAHDSGADPSELLGRLQKGGIDLEQTPTIVLADRAELSSLTPLLEQGVEDILARDVSLEFLATKLGRILARLDRPARTDDGAGAHGSLADMNLIDLLQALGPSRKTVHIEVQPKDREGELLTVFLSSGDISFAQCNTLTGPEAVYHAINWTDGTWTVRPVEEASIPPRNNTLSNESILMEGCRLVDEKLKAGYLQ